MQDLPIQPSGFVRFEKSEVEQSITNRFDSIVARAPRSVAVKDSDGSELAYDQLNLAANGVARSLLRLRGPAAEPVALLLGHGSKTISTVLGILKTGKFYVPLDPSYPLERLAFIVGDCPPSILVADSTCWSMAKELAPSGCALVHIDQLHELTDAENPGLTISPDGLAAVFYTSGSTAGPKGVMQDHRAVLHRAMVNTNTFGIHPHDRVSLLSSPSYSVSLRQLFGALLTGASICPFNVAREGLGKCAAWLSRERITVYVSVPTVFRQLISSLDGTEDFTSVRLVELGGEAVTRGDFELYKAHLSASCVFANVLASNEAGVLRIYVADKTTQFGGTTVPLGYEVEDKEILILDDEAVERKPVIRDALPSEASFSLPAIGGGPN
jgi:non-ribosomal peptide synthetase component F